MFDTRFLDRGPKPVYVEGVEPKPLHCHECGQVVPGEYEESPHVADCPCVRCGLMRRFHRPSSLKAGQKITFRKIAPIYPSGTSVPYRPEY